MKPALDVVFLTYNGLPQGDADDLLVLDQLSANGLTVSVLDWRTIQPDKLDSRLVVLRSTWDYHHFYNQFIDWVAIASNHSLLLNSAELVRWNSNKKYLLQLQAAGIPIAPTVYIEQNNAAAIDTIALRNILAQPQIVQARDLIIKPAIGLSTYGVKRFSIDRSGPGPLEHHIVELSAHGAVLIQPYLDAVEKYGERSLVFIGGAFSHSVRKAAFQKMAAAGEAGETAVLASPEEIAFAENVLQQLKVIKNCSNPLYARVDIVPDQNGRLLLLELELIEPSLFLAMAPRASDRFAQAIMAALTVSGG